MAQRVVIPGFRKIETGGSGEGGTNNYNDLTNKPSINNVPLVGNLNTANLKLTDATLTEEGVPAEAKTVGAKLEEHSASLLTLKEQLGNHTVKSDVPENAVFTDTVYNDTDIKAELAKKADATSVPSKVSELTNDSNYQTAEQVNSTVITEISKVVADAPEDFDTLKEMSDWIAGHEDDASAMNSAISDNKTAITALQTGKADKSEIPKTLPANGGNSDTVNNHTVETDVPVDAVFTDTIYDDTEVKGSIEELNSNLDGLEFGEVAGGKNLLQPTLQTTVLNGITCTANGDGTYTLNGTATNDIDFIICSFYFGNESYKLIGTPKGISNAYLYVNNNGCDFGDGLIVTGLSSKLTVGIYISRGVVLSNVILKPMITTDLNATYDDFVPYIPSVKMLAEEVDNVNESLADLGKCKNLVKYTLESTTINGITLTNNGDGTYTLNGTATSQVWFTLFDTLSLKAGKYKVVGCPSGGSQTTFNMGVSSGLDIGNGSIVTFTSDITNCWINIYVNEGVTMDNKLFKPMITECLEATYDDFVPYTGDGDTLTHDVAELKNDLSEIKFYDENGDFIIEHSNGDNISRLIMRANGTIDVQTLYNGNWKEATILSR